MRNTIKYIYIFACVAALATVAFWAQTKQAIASKNSTETITTAQQTIKLAQRKEKKKGKKKHNFYINWLVNVTIGI